MITQTTKILLVLLFTGVLVSGGGCFNCFKSKSNKERKKVNKRSTASNKSIFQRLKECFASSGKKEKRNQHYKSTSIDDSLPERHQNSTLIVPHNLQSSDIYYDCSGAKEKRNHYESAWIDDSPEKNQNLTRIGSDIFYDCYSDPLPAIRDGQSSYQMNCMENPIEEFVEERINLQQFVGSWKRSTPGPTDWLQFYKFREMIKNVLNTDYISKKFKFLKTLFWLNEDIGELAKIWLGKLVITINITKVGDILNVKPSYIEIPGFSGWNRIISRVGLPYLKTEVWSSNLSEVSVATVNGSTKRVCGFKYTSRGVEFGFLNCVDDAEIETCVQYVEMNYSLAKTNVDILEQHFTVYYLKQGAARSLKMEKECPRIKEHLYEERDNFTLKYSKQ